MPDMSMLTSTMQRHRSLHVLISPSALCPILVTRGQVGGIAITVPLVTNNVHRVAGVTDCMHALVTNPFLCCRSAAKVVCPPS